jgi:hypothetical protein
MFSPTTTRRVIMRIGTSGGAVESNGVDPGPPASGGTTGSGGAGFGWCHRFTLRHPQAETPGVQANRPTSSFCLYTPRTRWTSFRRTDHDAAAPDEATPAMLTRLDLSGFAPAEIRRRLRHACVLLGAAELPTDQREQILRRARGHLGGTVRKLDRLDRRGDRRAVVAR